MIKCFRCVQQGSVSKVTASPSSPFTRVSWHNSLQLSSVHGYGSQTHSAMATMMMNLSPTFIRQRLTLPLSSLNIPPLHLLISLFTSSGPICPPHNQNFICIATPTHSPNPTTEPASVTSVMSSAPRMEARLLHLYTSTKSSTGLWQLSHLTCCGMPTDPDMTRVNEPFAIGKTYCLSFLEVPPARGYGNLCFMDSSGPFVRDSVRTDNEV